MTGHVDLSFTTATFIVAAEHVAPCTHTSRKNSLGIREDGKCIHWFLDLDQLPRICSYGVRRCTAIKAIW